MKKMKKLLLLMTCSFILPAGVKIMQIMELTSLQQMRTEMTITETMRTTIRITAQ